MIPAASLRRSLVRVLVLGGSLAALTWGAGRAVERARFGSTDSETIERLESELRQRFATTAATLTTRVQSLTADPEAIRSASTDVASTRALFQRLEAIVEGTESTDGITVFSNSAAPLAWAGRVSDLPRERIDGPPALFAALDARGPRLVRIEAVADPALPRGSRLATIVAEQLVGTRAGSRSRLAETFLLPTSIVDVAVRAPTASGRPESPYVFGVRGPGDEILVEAEVSPANLAELRARWSRGIRAAALTVLAATFCLLIPGVLEWRRRQRATAAVVVSTVVAATVLVAARGLLWLGGARILPLSPRAPLALLLNGLLLVALTWLAIDLLERRRLSRAGRSFATLGSLGRLLFAGVALLAGAAASALVWNYLQLLRRVADEATVDLLRFSLHPMEPERLTLACGLLFFHAVVIWVAAAVLRLPGVIWRASSVNGHRWLWALTVAAGAVAVFAVVSRGQPGVLAVPWTIGVTLAGLVAATLSRSLQRLRRASQSARLGALFLALLLPALSMYPALTGFSTATRERLVATSLAPLAARQRDDLQARLPRALEAIDALPALADFVTSSGEGAAPTTDRAFLVWSQTELAASRTTSAVELYGLNGGLVSWFALNLPEYGTSPFRVERCDGWAPPYEETAPFGSSRRNVLRVSRAICQDNRRVGAIVVRLMLDYGALPFTSVDNPYLESLGPDRPFPSESAVDRDIEFAVYGWSRSVLYSSADAVWPLSDAVFDRMVTSREPFWASVVRGGAAFRVYFFNDRNGIYALGYPVVSLLGHLINLGELIFLAGMLYVVLLVVATIVNALTSHGPSSGRALLREFRSSFYRKLFVAFVASSVIPVVVLAFATRSYFTAQYRASVEEAAVKTATIAQRLVEDYAALQQRGAGALDLVDDQVMVLVRRAIDQDVNLFDRARLQATSERPLFASRLLPTRTPGFVYRSIALDRLPTTVTVEQVGDVPYLLAAAPVRTAGREGIVTVPQPLRSRELEEQSDELDRRVLSAAVLFVLLGSALGYWMAERIADPVNRLTRATRRIARGDLDARIAATSSDELRRLVEDFNRMASDLKRQRVELERTQRLQAWADMALQVAHDIKNPLTPIQLSAEHARRVNEDRGSPLSPVLDECVAAILSQVRLLRQISSEFSSFASSPTARPEATNLATLVDEVVQPYRTGLANRGLTLDVHAAEGLPPALVDRMLLGRALTNVIENALHAMPGGGALTLTVDMAADAPWLEIRVTDTGVGMDDEALRRLFEPYFSTKATGTGLGLTIAKRNVELNGGTVSVRSTRGVGTTVTIRLKPAA